MVPEFKIIWDRDKSKNKDKAKTELAYIYFLYHPMSQYLAYSSDEMEAIIVKDLFKTETYVPDNDLKQAIKKFKELSETPSTGLLTDARKAVSELRTFLRTVDLSERSKSGLPVYKASEVTKTLSDLDKVEDSLRKLEERVRKEEVSIEKARGGTLGGLMEFE